MKSMRIKSLTTLHWNMSHLHKSWKRTFHLEDVRFFNGPKLPYCFYTLTVLDRRIYCESMLSIIVVME